jgi:hypothetical protein
MKLCSRCKRTLPFDNFSVRKDGYSDGYRSMCRDCDYKRRRAHIFANPEHYQNYKDSINRHNKRNEKAFDEGKTTFPDKKLCRKCGKFKGTDEFWIRRKNRDGLQDHCIGCMSEYYAHYERRR